MIRIRDIALPPEHDSNQLWFEAAKQLKISASKVKKLTILRRSVDARKKPDVKIIYTVDVAVEGNEKKILKFCGSKKASLSQYEGYCVPKTTAMPDKRPVVVGFGPAGMFAALVLALAGMKPIVLERGADAVTRHQKVQEFWKTG